MADPEREPDEQRGRPATALPAQRPWRGDDHQLRLDAAGEVGLPADETALESYTEGFKTGMTLKDPGDGAIVLRGRTVLRKSELGRTLAPMLQYLGVSTDAVRLRVGDGSFELRIASRAAEETEPALGNAKLTLQVWVGFGLMGLAAYNLFPGYDFVAGILWGVGLLLGAWQLRRGVVSGRAMLAAHLALGLAMIAQEEQLILPPAAEDE